MAQDNDSYCESHQSDFDTCEHITTCINCTVEKRPFHNKKKFFNLGENDPPVYYVTCFYCILAGEKDLECQWDSYEEVVRQVMDGYHIGFRDGKYGKPKVDGKKCKMPEMAMLYNEGYEAGKNAQ